MMFFDGDNSSGVSGDLQSATAVSMFMEGYWGMGSAVSSHAVSKPSGSMMVTEGSLLRGEIGGRIEHRLAELLERVTLLLEQNRSEVLAVAHALEAHKTLTGEDVAAVILGTKGPLVDGRVYHQPTFMELAEAYHRHAVEAHRGKAKVAASLPVLTRLEDHAEPMGNGAAAGAGAGAAADVFMPPPPETPAWPSRPGNGSNGGAHSHDVDEDVEAEADDPTSP
jgi:hypothetical protein